MKRNLDERQLQEMNSMASKAFYLMFVISAAAIIIQLIFLNASLMSVIGETLTLLSGGSVYIVYSIKRGAFSWSGRPLTVVECIVGSTICAGIFSVFYAITICKKVGVTSSVGKVVGYFFIGIAFLCFIVLFVMSQYSKNVQKKKEEQYQEVIPDKVIPDKALSEKESKTDIRGKLLGVVADKVQAEMLLDILKQNGIFAYRQGIGSAAIMDIYGGNSSFGENIFVNERDFEQAKEIVGEFLEVSEHDIKGKSSKA